MEWIVLGDVHEDAGVFACIPGVAKADGLIISGDLTNRGGPREAGLVLAAARRANPAVLAQVGNMDEPGVTGFLEAEGANIHRAARLLAPGLALMGVGWSTPTPFDTPCETSEAELAAWLDAAHAAALALAGPQGKVLAVVHNAPHGTGLDRLSSGVSVGSRAVRAFLETAQPDICVCGHIHEGLGEERLGRCHVLNPGLAGDGGFVRVLFTDAGGLSARLERR